MIKNIKHNLVLNSLSLKGLQEKLSLEHFLPLKYFNKIQGQTEELRLIIYLTYFQHYYKPEAREDFISKEFLYTQYLGLTLWHSGLLLALNAKSTI